MALVQVHAQGGLEQRAEVDPVVAEQAPGQLGVEEPAGDESQPGQRRQVGDGGVHDPVRAGHHGGKCRGQFLAAALRGEEQGAGAAAAHLQQEDAVVVAEAGGALGVDGEGAAAFGEHLGAGGEELRGVEHPRQQVGGFGLGVEGLRVRLTPGLAFARGPAPDGPRAAHRQ